MDVATKNARPITEDIKSSGKFHIFVIAKKKYEETNAITIILINLLLLTTKSHKNTVLTLLKLNLGYDVLIVFDY